jgi:hypothetical protein
MPKVSLVVCVYRERALLERLLTHADGCYDELVVVHDGREEGEPAWQPRAPRPEWAIDYAVHEQARPAQDFWPERKELGAPGSIQSLILSVGGRFFEGPRCWQQEPHWPFAWSMAEHDWILRLDADEYPSAALLKWLSDFRKLPDLPAQTSGYTCIWPMWDGQRSVSNVWPGGRIFLFHRRRVSFFGMVEQVPVADQGFSSLEMTLHHEPARKSYGFRNILIRRQAYRWRAVIARALLGSPQDLPRWRWSDPTWPAPWSHLRNHPFKYAANALTFMPLYTAKVMVKNGIWPRPGIVFQSAIYHSLLALRYWHLRRAGGKADSPDEPSA